MKVLIQLIASKDFIQEAGQWTPDPDLALDFKNSTSAIKYLKQNDLKGIQVVLKFPESRYDIVLLQRDI